MATGAHTEHPGGKPQFPPFNKETFASQLVWLVVFFVALYVIIKRWAIPQIGGIIEARTEKIDGDLAEAKRLRDQSDAALAAYEKSLADARGRAGGSGDAQLLRLEHDVDQRAVAPERHLHAAPDGVLDHAPLHIRRARDR